MTHRPPPHNAHDDTGSVTPLIIAMMLCLLILGAGITAAGSAFLAGQSLQHLCDGAAAAAAGTITANTTTDQTATDTAHDYLAIRSPGTTATVVQDGTTLTVTCDADTPITFGALFATPTLHRTVTATAKTTYRTG